MLNQMAEHTNTIKTQFSIRDLEHLSGILAHTIRIWEKRYGLLNPVRTDGNIRVYGMADLHKLLNVATLYQQGYKISRLASYTGEQITRELGKLESEALPFRWKAELNLAMLEFDEALFQRCYDSVLSELGMDRAFEEVLIPFLHQIGLLWQSEAILPAHEHFISNLIRQKLFRYVDDLPIPDAALPVHVLFLPLNEIHELGLLYAHCRLRKAGKPSIYLGQSVPLDDIRQLNSRYEQVRYISYFTVQPHVDNAAQFQTELKEHILSRPSNEFWYLGRNAKICDSLCTHENSREFPDVSSLVEALIAS